MDGRKRSAGMAWPSLRAKSADNPFNSWRMFGIPIRIDASWFFILAFTTWSLAQRYFPSQYPGLGAGLSWLMGGIAAVLLFVCVLLHELGHSLVAKSYGIPVSCVTLFMFGGVAQISQNPKRPSTELFVAIAGPLVSALIAGACFATFPRIVIHGRTEFVVAATLQYLAMINVALVAFNLLPGYPLDGGRLLRAALWAWSGNVRWATRIASAIGSIVGFGLIGLGVWALLRGTWVGGMWYVLLGLFLRDAAQTSYRRAS